MRNKKSELNQLLCNIRFVSSFFGIENWTKCVFVNCWDRAVLCYHRWMWLPPLYSYAWIRASVNDAQWCQRQQWKNEYNTDWVSFEKRRDDFMNRGKNRPKTIFLELKIHSRSKDPFPCNMIQTCGCGENCTSSTSYFYFYRFYSSFLHIIRNNK